YANNLTERATRAGKEVYHGDIKEVSLVLAGANPGAYIETVGFRHGDGQVDEIDEAIIYTGFELMHGDQIEKEIDMGDKNAETIEHAEVTAETIKEVFEGLDDTEKAVVYFMLGDAVERAKAENAKAGDDAAE